ncbi:probable inactive receptor kinase At2g26730 [Rutidosis leptorrhynchoides]|uniref:probable inactive receptor kinase At2g26730 n=1 Tax=Rutidosis leptorrhynchoides TaxID=125765 RepID=UPI003A98E71E
MSFFHFLLITLFFNYRVSSESTQEKQALLSFLSQVPHASRISWNSNQPTCSWTGVTCDSTNTSVISVRLPGTGLIGTIPPNTIGKLSQLRVLSLHSNALTGEFPPDFSNLSFLRNVYLQNNKFTGEFPPSFTDLTRLTRLDLSANNLTGAIPFSINNLTVLTGLFLHNNSFSGQLPSINPASLVDINVSNNKLNGSIPKSLARFPVTAFSGNINLCGSPLPPCNSTFFPAPAPSPPSIEPPSVGKKHKKKLSTAGIVAIVVGSVLIIALLLLILLLCLRKKRNQKTNQVTKPSQAVPASAAASRAVAEAGTSSSKDDITGASTEGERNKLVFFEGGIYSFDLEDLLRASAEVLGKGSVGTSYKAVLEEGTTVVVKRLKDVVVTKKEFDLQMEVLGKMKDENVVPLRAYYYSKDEKLLVYDYFPAGSLSALLHGSRGSGRSPLDWDHRMRIALSAARGVAYLHVAGKVVHGNIKSSNVLLRQETNKDASVSDYGLNTLFGGSSTPNNRVTGYRAPEILETRKATFKSDVYSFGVLLLELLTGKAPNQASLGEEGIDLPRWVQSVVREEWTAEVFDVELMRYQNIEEEMVQLLQIAMACVSTVPDQRPAMQEVVRMMEDMNRAETDDGMRQSSDDPSKESGGHTPPTEARNSPSTVTP